MPPYPEVLTKFVPINDFLDLFVCLVDSFPKILGQKYHLFLGGAAGPNGAPFSGPAVPLDLPVGSFKPPVKLALLLMLKIIWNLLLDIAHISSQPDPKSQEGVYLYEL